MYGSFHLPHGAYGHNRDVSDAVLSYGSSSTAFIHSASCELKFH